MSPDEKYLAMSSYSNYFQVWDVEQNQIVLKKYYEIEQEPDSENKLFINSSRFTPDNQYLVVEGAISKTKPWGAVSYTPFKRIFEVGSFDSVEADVQIRDYSKTGKYYIKFTGSPDWELNVYNSSDNTLALTCPGASRTSTSIDFSSDDKYFITSDKGSLHFYAYKMDDLSVIAHYYKFGGMNITINRNNSKIYFSAAEYLQKIASPWSTNGILPIISNNSAIYPNPAGNSFTVETELSKPTQINMQIFDTAGNLVAENDMGYYESGKHNVANTTKNLTTGTYFVTLNGNGFQKTYKLVVK